MQRPDDRNRPAKAFHETLRIIRDDPRSAVGRLRNRIIEGDADYRTWHNLAVALLNAGDLAGAVEAVRTAVDTQPESTVSHFLHGVLLRDADRLTESLAAFDRVEELEPSYPRLHAHRGVVQFFREDADAALADLEIAVERDPEDSSSLFNLAVVNVSLKRFSAAQTMLERLIELEPERASYYHSFLVELGRVEVIEETMTQAHRIKNFMGIVGDRLRSLCERELDHMGREAREDLLAVRQDYEQIFADLVVFLRAIQPRSLRPERVDLRRLVDRVVFVAVDQAEGVGVEREFRGELPEIVCDVELLQEALLNLLINALDAVRAAGRSGDRKGRVRIATRPTAEGIEIAFIDNGVGIAPGDLGRVFKFGFTTKSLGTGIGLTFTRKIIEDHGGRIEVESEEGKGTTIRLQLPSTPTISESLSNLALRSQLLHDPRELILEEGGEDLGI